MRRGDAASCASAMTVKPNSPRHTTRVTNAQRRRRRPVNVHLVGAAGIGCRMVRSTTPVFRSPVATLRTPLTNAAHRISGPRDLTGRFVSLRKSGTGRYLTSALRTLRCMAVLAANRRLCESMGSPSG